MLLILLKQVYISVHKDTFTRNVYVCVFKSEVYGIKISRPWKAKANVRCKPTIIISILDGFCVAVAIRASGTLGADYLAGAEYQGDILVGGDTGGTGAAAAGKTRSLLLKVCVACDPVVH